MVGLLVACGGDEPNAFAFEDPNDAYTRSLELFSAAYGEPATQLVDVRPLGSATYQGYALVALDDGVERLNYLGTFELEADFVGNGIAGSASDFVGVEQVALDGTVTATGDVSGTLSIANGLIFGDAGRADFDVDIDGTLQDGGTRVVIDTTIFGGFWGAQADYIVASDNGSATAEVTTVSSGASIQDLDLILLGERQ